MSKLKKHTVKMNITMSQEFHDILVELSAKDYLKPSTWVKQHLMKSVLDKYQDDHPIKKELQQEMKSS